jgi:hypothetical protein
MNKNKELLRSIIREAIEEITEESYEHDEAQEVNLMKQIQAAAHWLDAHKGASPEDVAKAVSLIKGRIDMLVKAHEQGKEVPSNVTPEHPTEKYREEGKVSEVAPPGWEGTVKAMKKHKDIDNPWALAWSMKNKGMKSHKK